MFKSSIAKDIVRLIAFKLIALVAIYAAFFSPSHRKSVDPLFPISWARQGPSIVTPGSR